MHSRHSLGSAVMMWLVWVLVGVVGIVIIFLAVALWFCWQAAVNDPIDHSYGYDYENTQESDREN